MQVLIDIDSIANVMQSTITITVGFCFEKIDQSKKRDRPNLNMFDIIVVSF